MPRRPSRASQTDIRAAIRAAESAGVRVSAVRILPDGTIEIAADEKKTNEEHIKNISRVREFTL